MRLIKGVLTLLTVLAFVMGSYASAHSLPAKKAIDIVIVIPSDYHEVIVQNFNGINSVAIMPEQFYMTESYDYYIPLKIGKVIKRPANYKYLNIQHYYSCNNHV